MESKSKIRDIEAKEPEKEEVSNLLSLLTKYLGLTKEDPSEIISVANTLSKLHKAYAAIDHYSEAEKAYKEAFDIYINIINQSYDNIETNDVGFAILSLGNLYSDKGLYAEAEKAYFESLNLYNRKDEDNPFEESDRFYDILGKIANLYKTTGRYYEAMRVFKECLTIYEAKKKSTRDYRKADTLAALGSMLAALGSLYNETGQPAEAIEAYTEARSIYRGIILFIPPFIAPPNSELIFAGISADLASLYKATGNNNEAVEAYEEAVYYYRLGMRNIQNNDIAINLASTLVDLGSIYKVAGRHDEARSTYEEAAKVYNNITTTYPQTNHSILTDFANTLNNLGNLYRDKAYYKKAEKAYWNALTIFNELFEQIGLSEAKSTLGTYLYGIAVTANNLNDLYLNMSHLKKDELKKDSSETVNYGIINSKEPEEYKLPKLEDSDNTYEIHTFSASLPDVLKGIQEKTSIDGIILSERIQDPKFRFKTQDFPALSLLVSQTLANLVKETKPLYAKKASKKGAKKRNENADEFALRMYNIIENLRNEEKITSYRETAKLLNERHTPTYRGGEWHIKTLQDLNKRWKELGLIHDPKPK